jgi:hypothetical protein
MVYFWDKKEKKCFSLIFKRYKKEKEDLKALLHIFPGFCITKSIKIFQKLIILDHKPISRGWRPK